MFLFCTDMDNTIIYSYKHDIGPSKRNVELYQGREISFITERTYELLNRLKKLDDKIMIVPTSTRTIEQYNRINLGIGDFKYSMVCNGGILLRDNIRDDEWYNDSLLLIRESQEEIDKSIKYLEKDKRRTFELRYIEDLFVFTKCDEPEQVVEDLKAYLNTSMVDVFNNGTKVYVVPRALNKGNAVRRLNEIIGADKIIAAGDSEFDISMLEYADYGLCPYGFIKEFSAKSDLIEAEENITFSEFLLDKCLNLV